MIVFGMLVGYGRARVPPAPASPSTYGLSRAARPHVPRRHVLPAAVPTRWLVSRACRRGYARVLRFTMNGGLLRAARDRRAGRRSSAAQKSPPPPWRHCRRRRRAPPPPLGNPRMRAPFVAGLGVCVQQPLRASRTSRCTTPTSSSPCRGVGRARGRRRRVQAAAPHAVRVRDGREARPAAAAARRHRADGARARRADRRLLVPPSAR